MSDLEKQFKPKPQKPNRFLRFFKAIWTAILATASNEPEEYMQLGDKNPMGVPPWINNNTKPYGGQKMNCPNIYSQDTCRAKRIKCDDCGIEDCIHFIKPYEDDETGKEQMYCPECIWRRESKKQKPKILDGE